MGVKGLWSLLNPVARPVQIETMEGKRLAIDSSIWLYQFQATMRDKDGRVLVNAHVLGFLRRINKLLFHGIKPVFVFDGGAPALKRATIAERKRKKAGAAANHARMAEKLFAAQMRREAVKVAQIAKDQQAAKDATFNDSRYPDEAGEQIAENAVYLEDLEGRPGPSAPRPAPVPIAQSQTPSTSSIPAPSDPAEERRKRFRKHDPYRLPETTMPTVSTEDKPDARLVTEAELKQFIDEVHPEDIDVESAEFRALPTEVQYEIIGDLRIRSRQQSHRRLVDMLRAAPTALDFSRAQIKHLSQRNALTQQLLTVTDMVGKAHLTIPVRIAAERNREYVLVKRGESEGGGWALGIREGTKANPIKVEEEEKGSEDSDDSDGTEMSDGAYLDIEEVLPDKPPSVDPDLRERRRREMLEAIVARYTPNAPARPSLDVPVKSFGSRRKPGTSPLFEQDTEDIVPTANDEALALALQQEELGSDEEEADIVLAKALAISRKETERLTTAPVDEGDVPTRKGMREMQDEKDGHDSDDSLEEVSLVPSGRSTPLPFSRDPTPIEVDDEEEMEAVEVKHEQQDESSPRVVHLETVLSTVDEALGAGDRGSGSTQAKPIRRSSLPELSTAGPVKTPNVSTPSAPAFSIADTTVAEQTPQAPNQEASPVPTDSSEVDVVDDEPSEGRDIIVENVHLEPAPSPSTPPLPPRDDEHLPDFYPETPEGRSRLTKATDKVDNEQTIRDELRSPHRRSAASLLAFMDPHTDNEALSDLRAGPSRTVSMESVVQDQDDETEDGEKEEDDSRSIDWSKSPSPRPNSRSALQPEESTESVPMEIEDDEATTAREDMVAEEDDYARFMAQIKNRDLNEVRTEIDDEIRVLNAQNKVAMRDSDEITQSMIAQIQTLLRHFGIPYITAPMEAEAQCAKLAELGLVDGIITDDSDVFLFGGKQCFKNIFNDAKYAECFLLTDIDRELSLNRERLISLAYLLGSDYTIGLPGVGPVVALELLANFPGEKGILDFRAWWTKVQRGQDGEMDTDTKWKKSFKNRYSSIIFLTNDWPNMLVREAYKYPETDGSEEAFHWGFPKLSALRAFLHEELSWSISKVDDELTPIVQRLARRGKVGALNVQGTLDPFFDTSIVSGNYAPRKRTIANVSKRLMAVIKQFREAEARVKGVDETGWGEMMAGLDEEDPKGRGTGKRRRSIGGKGRQQDVEENGGEDGEESQEKTKKKPRRPRARKGTESSVVISEGGDEVEATSTADPNQDIRTPSGNAQWAKNMPTSRGGKKGKGTRRWVGPRWDVVEKPEN